MNAFLDAEVAQLFDLFDTHGATVVLLKGAPYVHMLYGDRDARGSTDIDLIADPADQVTVESVLDSAGYRRTTRRLGTDRPLHAEVWERGVLEVDLHRDLIGVAAPRVALWDVLRRHCAKATVGGREVVTTDEPLSLVMVATHAAQHGESWPQALADLEVCVAGPRDWETAVQVAWELDALDAFAAGLRLSTTGKLTATHLGLPAVTTPLTTLRSSGAHATAEGFAWLAEEQSGTARLKYLAGQVTPPPEFMRDWRPIARSGRLGLALAYLYRPLWLAWWAPRGYLAWRRAKKVAEASQRAGQD